MTATVEYYADVLEQADLDTESLTIVVVAGATREQVAEALQIDLSAPGAGEEVLEGGEEDFSAYCLVDVTGGVMAVETTGYADPTNRALRQMSSAGGAAAVARDNIQAHSRFGCARDGVLVFDDHEYTYVDDLSRVPEELRPLVDLVRVDLDADDDPDDQPEPLVVGLAMAEVVTGIRLTAEDFSRIGDMTWYAVPTQLYAAELD